MNRTILILDSHQLSQFQHCPRRFYYGTVRALAPKTEKTALTKGRIFHILLSTYYESLKKGSYSPEMVMKLSLDILNDEENGLELTDKQIIAQRFVEYCKHYQNCGEFIPLRTETEDNTGFSRTLYENNKVIFVYEGRNDLIIKYEGEQSVWVDHKTQNPKYAFDLHPYTNQFIGYSWALGCTTGIVNYITWAKVVNDKTFRRAHHVYPQQLIEKWRASTIRTYFDILDALNSKDYEYRWASCETKYGPCQFSDICTKTNENAERWVIENRFEKQERWRAF